MNNICNFKNITNNSEILNIIRGNFLQLFDPYYGKSQIFQGEGNVTYQITSEKNELELLNGDFLNNQNISIIDLGECGTTLKKINHLDEEDSLIFIKQENTNCKASEKNVKYEVYEAYSYSRLNLSVCSEDNINTLFSI